MKTLVKKEDKFNPNALYNRRIEMGLALEDIAKIMKCTKQAVYQWESEICKPCPKNMRILAKLLKVEISYFFQNDKNNSIN